MKKTISKSVIIAEEDIREMLYVLEVNAKTRLNLWKRHFYLRGSKIYDDESREQYEEDERNFERKYNRAKDLVETFKRQFAPINHTF